MQLLCISPTFAEQMMGICTPIQEKPMTMLQPNNEQSVNQQESTRNNKVFQCSLYKTQKYGCQIQARSELRTKRATCARNASKASKRAACARNATKAISHHASVPCLDVRPLSGWTRQSQGRTLFFAKRPAVKNSETEHPTLS